MSQTLEDALDTTNLVWTTGGDAAWFAQTTNTHDGVDAVQSGVLGSNQTSWVETMVMGPATISFWHCQTPNWPWRIGDSTHSFTVNGRWPYQGIVWAYPIGHWGQHTNDLEAGTNVLRWEVLAGSEFSEPLFVFLDGVTVAPPRPLAIVYQPTDQTAFSGEMVIFDAAVVGTPPYAFQWQKDGVDLVGETNSWLWFNTTTTNDSGVYSASVSNSQGQLTSSNAVLTVNDSAPFFSSQPASRTNYTGESSRWYEYARGSQPMSYQWKKDGTNLVGSTSSILVISNLSLADAGNYSLLVTNEWGSIESSNATLTVIQSVAPEIIKHPRSLEVAEGVSTWFVAEATGAPFPQYSWMKPGDVPPPPPDPTQPPLPPVVLSHPGPSKLSLTNVSATNAGLYRLAASNVTGTAVSRDALLTVLPPITPIGSWWQGAYDIFVTNGFAYLAQGSAGLAIVDVSDPGAPFMVGGYNTPGYAYSVHVVDGLAYVADGSFGIQVLSVTNPFNPVLVGGYDTPGTAYDITVDDRIAFVADSSRGLLILDVSNAETPAMLSTFKTNFSASYVSHSKDSVIVSSPYSEVLPGTNVAGLFLIDVSDPANPFEVGRLSSGVGRFDVRDGVVIGVRSGISLISITNPSQPSVLGNLSVSASDARVVNDLAYVIGNLGGEMRLSVFDVRDPTEPIPVGSYRCAGYAQALWVDGNLVYGTGDGGLLHILQTPFNVNTDGPPSLWLSTEFGLTLGLRGHRGRHYEIEHAESMAGFPWLPFDRVFITNETAEILVPMTAGPRFFRARRLD